jgi:hypothetical protein
MYRNLKKLRVAVCSKKIILGIIILICLFTQLHAQTLYVDAVNGKDDGTGSFTSPLKNLEKAVAITNTYTGQQAVHIKLAPGLYTVAHVLNIKTALNKKDILPYTIEATIMPDDAKWQPASMPIIQSVGGNNMNDEFNHCVALLITKDNVSIKGVKFIGNPNPGVNDYYPIRRIDQSLSELTVSQCYFVGEKNSTPIQSAFWVNGLNIKVDHCIFYNCKNSLVLGYAINGFSLTYSIISGSYESAIWYGAKGTPFTFSHNIVTNCNFLMVHRENKQPDYTISDSYITGNDHYLGYYNEAQDHLFATPTTNIKEINISKTGKIVLVPVKTEGMPHNYLNLDPSSDGKSTMAGIFKK